MTDNRASIKTTKSALDTQMDNAIKELKHRKGISFALRRGNSIEYVFIPSHPDQLFRYFINTSHMTNAERQDIYKRKNEIKLLTRATNTLSVSDEDKTVIASAIDKKAIKALAEAEGLI